MKDPHLSGKGKAGFKKQSQLQTESWRASGDPASHQRTNSSYGTDGFWLTFVILYVVNVYLSSLKYKRDQVFAEIFCRFKIVKSNRFPFKKLNM